MRGWNDLPAEMRREVVKSLNILDRNSLRNSSKFDQQVVDSLKISLPHVNLYHLSGYVILEIYAGINERFRLEFGEENGRTSVDLYRTKYTEAAELNDSKLAPLKFTALEDMQLVQKKSSLPAVTAAVHAFKNLLMHPNIQVDSLEWGLTKENADDLLSTNEKISCSKITARSRVLETLQSLCREPTRSPYEHYILTQEDYDLLSGTDLHRFVPIYSAGLMINSRPLNTYHYSREDWRGELMEGIPVEGQCVMWMGQLNRLDGEEDFPETFLFKYCLVRSEFVDVDNVFDRIGRRPNWATERINENVLVKKVWSRSGAHLTQHHLTPCGMWAVRINSQNEAYVQDIPRNNKCGLGVICPRCTDPFDYWYARCCPLRMKRDKEWVDAKNRRRGEEVQSGNGDRT